MTVNKLPLSETLGVPHGEKMVISELTMEAILVDMPAKLLFSLLTKMHKYFNV